MGVQGKDHRLSRAYIEAQLRYADLNAEAIRRASVLMSRAIRDLPSGITLSPIDQSDIDAATAAGWVLDWDGFFNVLRNRPRKFALKIQCDGVTCGMALGTMNRSKSILRIELVEGNTVVQTATKGYIIEIVLLAATAYALLGGCKEIRCINPVDKVVALYERAGMTLVQDKGFRYCGKDTP